MLEQIARHGSFDLKVRATGDVEIDGHHTTEDLAVTLGQALGKAQRARRVSVFDLSCARAAG